MAQGPAREKELHRATRFDGYDLTIAQQLVKLYDISPVKIKWKWY